VSTCVIVTVVCRHLWMVWSICRCWWWCREVRLFFNWKISWIVMMWVRMRW